MSGWGQNQGGWGGQQSTNQGGWGGQQPTNQGGWGGQQQGWNTQGTQNQGSWGSQGTQGQSSWGTQGQQQGGWGQQGGLMGTVTNLFNKISHRTKPNKLSRPYYSFASEKADGKVFDICQNHPNNSQLNGSLIIWDHYGGPNQSFGIVQENGKYLFKCKQPSGYLTVQGPQDGALFFISPNKTGASYFDFIPVGDKKYQVVTCYGKAMDIQNQNKSNGTSVIQWPIKQSNNDNQVWMLMDPKDITSSSD